MEFLYGLLMAVPLWIILPIVVVVILYRYLTRQYDYFKKRGIPYVSPIPVLGTTKSSFFDALHYTEVKRYKEKGRIYGGYEGEKPVITIAEPEILKDILVKDFQYFSRRRDFATGNPIMDKMISVVTGEDWKRIRTIITPTFTTGKIKKMTSIFTDSSKTLAQNFEKAARSGKPVECKSYFGAFAMDVIANSAFGTKIDSYNDPQNKFVVTARSLFSRNVPWRYILMVLFPKIMKMFQIAIFSPEAMEFFKNVTLQIIKERKEKKQSRNDFLQLLMESLKETEADVKAKDQSNDDNDDDDSAFVMDHEESNKEVFKPAYIRKTLSENEMVAQCVSFFLAGYDSTSSTLSFTAYELAVNPTIQEKLISEVDETFRQRGEFTYEAIRDMQYLDRVLSETLRKYPPGVRSERLCDTDYHLKDTNITVPKGMLVGIPVYAMHHDPDYYSDPEKYDPERFTAEERERRHPYTYLPFGAGPRNCIGKRFALMEIKVCMANLLRQFRFRICRETKIPLRFYSGQFLLQPKDVFLKVEKRTDISEM